jgi:hypothetical protein
VQYAVVVLDHIAQGFHVALDEAGDDLAFEAAVFTLLTTRWPTMNFIRIRSLISVPPDRAWRDWVPLASTGLISG